MDPCLSWTLALALTILFAASAAMKFAGLAQFAAAVEDYRILPAVLVGPAAWIIPAIEGSAAVGLLIPVTQGCAAAILAVLVGMFTAAIAVNLARGRRQIDCGCFGPALRQTLSGWLIGRNLILIGAAIIVARPMGSRPMGGIDAVTIVCGALSLMLLYLSTNYIVANAPWIRELERINA
jgi:hypothetical protein